MQRVLHCWACGTAARGTQGRAGDRNRSRGCKPSCPYRAAVHRTRSRLNVLQSIGDLIRTGTLGLVGRSLGCCQGAWTAWAATVGRQVELCSWCSRASLGACMRAGGLSWVERGANVAVGSHLCSAQPKVTWSPGLLEELAVHASSPRRDATNQQLTHLPSRTVRQGFPGLGF